MGCAVGGAACDKATLDFLSRSEFTTGECSRAGDGVTSTVISGCLSFEHRQDTFGAVGSPRGNQASVVLAERLRREFTCHPSIVGFTLSWGGGAAVRNDRKKPTPAPCLARRSAALERVLQFADDIGLEGGAVV